MAGKRHRRIEPPGKAAIRAKADAAESRSAGMSAAEPRVAIAPAVDRTPAPASVPLEDAAAVVVDKVKSKGGRPTKYTKQLGIEICTHISAGLSLRSIQDLDGMPDRGTVLRWVIEDREGFAAIYARAREIQLECEADEIVDIADDGRNDWMEREGRDGETYVVANKEAVSRSSLRVSTRQWRLARLMQGKYGDKIEQKHTGMEAFAAIWSQMGGGASKAKAGP